MVGEWMILISSMCNFLLRRVLGVFDLEPDYLAVSWHAGGVVQVLMDRAILS
jgi:hypothetical protein